jgi:hypothetical protein
MNKNLSAWVGAKISEFKAKMAEVSKIMHSTATGSEIPIDGNTRPISTKIAEVKARLASIRDKTVEIHAKIDKKWDAFGMDLDMLATRMRTFGTIGQSSISGLVTTISSAGIPAVASLIAGIGSLGPILAVAAGGAAGLGTAFALAGAGVGAFAAVAITNLKGVFDANKKITDLQNKAAQATDIKQRNKYLQQEKAILASMAGPQREAYTAIQNLKAAWTGITKPLEAQTVNTFTQALQGLTIVLGYLKPAFSGASQAMNNLTQYMNAVLKQSSVVNFFKVLGQTMGLSLETAGLIAINVMEGLMNLFTAFVPLGQKMLGGLLSMTNGFRTWSQTVAQSTGFRNFISYVTVNGPKLLQIIGNIGLGLVGMFSGFAPTASSMLTSLVSLTNQFKVWGQTLASNQQFQQFIAYAQANAPAVIAVIGNLVQVIGALAVGFAPVGAAVVQFLVPFTQMIASFLQANPIIASIIAIVVSVIGVFIALAPTIMAVTTVIGALIPVVGAIAGALGGFLAFLVSWPVLIAAAAAILVAIIINNWSSIWAFLKGLWSSIVSVGAALWNGFVSMMSGVWNTIKSVTMVVWNAIRGFLSGLWNGIRSLASAAWNGLKSAISTGWNAIRSVTSSVWNGIRSFLYGLWNGIRSTASSVWNGIKGTIIGIVNGLRSGISAVWNGIRSVTSSVWGAIRGITSGIWNGIKSTVIGLVNGMRNGISSAWNGIKSSTSAAFQAVVSFIKNPLQSINLFSIGKNVIQGLVNGIGSMAGAVWNAVKSVAGGIKSKIMGMLGIHSPSRVMAWVGQMTGQGLVNGISGMQQKVAYASQGMAQAAQIAPQQTTFSYASDASTNGFGSLQQEVTANMDKMELSKKPAEINLIVGSKKIANAIIDDINNLQGKQEVNHAIFQ